MYRRFVPGRLQNAVLTLGLLASAFLVCGLTAAQQPRPLVVLKCHSDGVRCLAFSPDGKTIASTGFDSTLRVWDVPTGKETASIKTGKEYVTALGFSPDGKTLATASGGDGGVGLWDLPARKRRTPEQELVQEIMSQVAFSPDGKSVALASWCSGRLEVWDVTTCRRTAALRKPEQSGGGPQTVAFTAGGREVVAWGTDGGLERWEASGRKRPEKAGVGQKAHRGAITPDGKLLVTGEDDWDGGRFCVRVWDVAGRRERSSITGRGGLYRLVVSRDGRAVAVSCDGGEVVVWDVATGKERLRLGGGSREGRVLALGPDGTVLATGGFEEKVINLWAVPEVK